MIRYNKLVNLHNKGLNMKNNTMIPYNAKKDLETNYYNKTEVELLLAGGAATINASSAIIQNQTTGDARVKVIYGGTINAVGIDTTGGTIPVFSQPVNTLTQNGIIYG